MASPGSVRRFPLGLHPPLAVALAKSVRGIRTTVALPGQMCLNPSETGFSGRIDNEPLVGLGQGPDRCFADPEALPTKMVPDRPELEPADIEVPAKLPNQ